jgi:hypothetical protein
MLPCNNSAGDVIRIQTSSLMLCGALPGSLALDMPSGPERISVRWNRDGVLIHCWSRVLFGNPVSTRRVEPEQRAFQQRAIMAHPRRRIRQELSDFSIFRAQIFSRGLPRFSGGHVQSSMDSVVSIAICQRSRRQRLRSARASLVRKTISSSGCRAMTKSSPSHLIATCRRYSMDPSPMRDQYIPPYPRARLPVDLVHLYLCRSPLRLELSHFRSRWILAS